MPLALWPRQSGMMLTARPPLRVHTKRRRSAIDGKGARSSTPAVAKVTKAERRQEACAHITRKALALIDFRRAIVGGGMRPSSFTSNQTRPIEDMRSASITTSREVARRVPIRAKKDKPDEARGRFAVGGAICACRRAPCSGCRSMRCAHSLGLPCRKSGARGQARFGFRGRKTASAAS